MRNAIRLVVHREMAAERYRLAISVPAEWIFAKAIIEIGNRDAARRDVNDAEFRKRMYFERRLSCIDVSFE